MSLDDIHVPVLVTHQFGVVSEQEALSRVKWTRLGILQRA